MAISKRFPTSLLWATTDTSFSSWQRKLRIYLCPLRYQYAANTEYLDSHVRWRSKPPNRIPGYFTLCGIIGNASVHGLSRAGVAGNEILGWADLDSEIKTTDLKNVSGNASSFATLRLLIAYHRISLRSCMTCTCRRGFS